MRKSSYSMQITELKKNKLALTEEETTSINFN